MNLIIGHLIMLPYWPLVYWSTGIVLNRHLVTIEESKRTVGYRPALKRFMITISKMLKVAKAYAKH